MLWIFDPGQSFPGAREVGIQSGFQAILGYFCL